ncbi:hypothetical protein N7G274_001642 [Stereocaulon virgatum]|uniref:Uncharacterized protein n=1 Tax=Stereocaulon virgatum TaxID=373712 RepID=A0ABR4AL41_9LECA
MLLCGAAEDEKAPDISLLGWDVGNAVKLLSMLYELEVEGFKIEGAGTLLLNEVVDSVEEMKDWEDDDIAEEAGLVAGAVENAVAESGVFKVLEELLLDEVTDDCGAPLGCTAIAEEIGLFDEDEKLLDGTTDDENKLLDGVDVDGDDDDAAIDDGNVFDTGEEVEGLVSASAIEVDGRRFEEDPVLLVGVEDNEIDKDGEDSSLEPIVEGGEEILLLDAEDDRTDSFSDEALVESAISLVVAEDETKILERDIDGNSELVGNGLAEDAALFVVDEKDSVTAPLEGIIDDDEGTDEGFVDIALLVDDDEVVGAVIVGKELVKLDGAEGELANKEVELEERSILLGAWSTELGEIVPLILNELLINGVSEELGPDRAIADVSLDEVNNEEVVPEEGEEPAEGAVLLEVWDNEDVLLVSGVSDKVEADRKVMEIIDCRIEVELLLVGLGVTEGADVGTEDEAAEDFPVVEDVLFVNGVGVGLEVDRGAISFVDSVSKVDLLPREVEVVKGDVPAIDPTIVKALLLVVAVIDEVWDVTKGDVTADDPRLRAELLIGGRDIGRLEAVESDDEPNADNDDEAVLKLEGDNESMERICDIAGEDVAGIGLVLDEALLVKGAGVAESEDVGRYDGPAEEPGLNKIMLLMDVGRDDGDVREPMFDAALIEGFGELDAVFVVELAEREDVVVKELVVADPSVLELGDCGFEEAAGGGEKLLNKEDIEFNADVARVDSEEDCIAEELIILGDVLVNGPRDDKVDDCELTVSEVSDDIRLDVSKLVILTGVELEELGKVGAVEVSDEDATEPIELDELFGIVDAEKILDEAFRDAMAVVATLLEAEVPRLELEPELLEADRVLNNMELEDEELIVSERLLDVEVEELPSSVKVPETGRLLEVKDMVKIIVSEVEVKEELKAGVLEMRDVEEAESELGLEAEGLFEIEVLLRDVGVLEIKKVPGIADVVGKVLDLGPKF